MKGADSTILERLHPDTPHADHEKLSKIVSDWSVVGLRTLVFAKRSVSKDEWNKFFEK